MTTPSVFDLLVPIKPLQHAKSRLRGAADGGDGRTAAHAALVRDVALDTVAAARAASAVRRVVVVTSDTDLTEVLHAENVDVIADVPEAGLNPALQHGARLLDAPDARVGALQADLPALRPDELDAALASAGARRAFCPDRHGTGTTLLVAAAAAALDPRFGPDSADAHAASGAVPLGGAWATLRCDVDTAEDLAAAAALGLGPRTTARLEHPHAGTCRTAPSEPASKRRT